MISTSIPFLRGVTVLEALIGFTQLAAVYFNIASGVRNLNNSFTKRKQCKHFLHEIDQITLTNSHQSKLQPETVYVARNVIENEFLSSFWCGIIVGIWEVIFGVSFFFLFMNSYHLHTSTWPKPVIDALIFMEIGLLYILGIMVTSIVNKIQKSKFIRNFIDELKLFNSGSKLSIRNYVTSSRNISPVNNTNSAYLRYVYMTLEEFYSSDNYLNPSNILANITDDEITQTSVINDYLITLQSNISKNQMDTASIKRLIRTLETQEMDCGVVLDCVYLLLNAVAGYGYLLGIFAFYLPNNSISRMFMFGLSDADGDWWGNLAGDAAWTIEPFLIIFMEEYTRRQMIKPKTD